MTRVSYLSRDDAAPGTEHLWQRLEAERKRPTANIFRALAHAPAQLDAFLSYANALREGSQLSPKLRELAILTVGHVAGSVYEVAHHQSHALKAGVTQEQLRAIADYETSPVFDEVERAIMRLADESTAAVEVSDKTWAAVAAHLDEQTLVQLVLTIGWYNSGVRIMGLLDIDLEPGYRG